MPIFIIGAEYSDIGLIAEKTPSACRAKALGHFADAFILVGCSTPI
jgi:hypothetical protein